MEKYDSILTLSGGIDSTVLAHHLVHEGRNPLCVYIDYGTKSRDAELAKAGATANLLKLKLKVIPFPIYKDITKAYILGNTEEYEEGSAFWLEGRNAIIGMVLAIMAGGMGLREVFLGINAGDNEGGEYVDTDSRFIAALNLLIQCSCKSNVRVVAPWLDMEMTKGKVIELGKTYGVNWVKQTHSCSTTTGSEPCLDYYECESCYERRYAFEEVGMKDPFYKGGDY